MPVKTWDKATFDAAYRVGGEWATGYSGNRPEIKLHYSRYIFMPRARKLAYVYDDGGTVKYNEVDIGVAAVAEQTLALLGVGEL